MKKRYKKLGIILLVLALFLLIANQLTPTGNITYNPLNCSQEDIGLIWDSIFEEPSAGITIVKDSTCEKFYAYKINSDELSLIMGNTNLGEWVSATHGIFNSELINSVESNNLDNFVPNTLTTSFPPEQESNLTKHAKNRSIDQTKAESIFGSIFKPQITTWSKATDPTNMSRTSYVFSEETINGNELNSSSGYIEANLTLEQYLFLRTTEECQTNWTKQLTTCDSNETQMEYYTDSSSCGTTSGQTENETLDCDYQTNGVIGKYSEANIKNLDFNIKTSNNSLNESTNFSKKQKVSIFNKNKEIITFEWNFSKDPINLRNIKVEKQSNSSQVGYIIINGIEASKEVKVDRIRSANQVCIKDAKVSSISQISASCTGVNEHLVNCPGTKGKYSCNLTSTEFIVTGMAKSAVLEHSGNTTTTCSALWSCTQWNECNAGSKTRVCTDENSCNDITTKPAESTTCGTICTPNWECSVWAPEECPEGGTQERNCIDSNSCELTSTKPSEEKSCTYTGKVSRKAWIITFLIIMILVVVILLIISIIKRRQGKTPSTKPNTFRKTPPGIPPQVQRRIPPRRPLQRQPGRKPIRQPIRPIPRRPPLRNPLRKQQPRPQRTSPPK